MAATSETWIGLADISDLPAYAPPPRLAHQRRPSAGALTTPTADLVVDHQRDQGGPDRHAADEVLGAVDRVDHPAPRTPAGVLHLLAVHRVPRPGPAERAPQRLLDGGVGVGDRASGRAWRSRADRGP